MTPTAMLPSGYAERAVTLVLTRSTLRRGWEFRFRSDEGYSVSALNPRTLQPLFNGDTFATRHEADLMAKAVGLPGYATWNGRARKYEGLNHNAYRTIARAHDAQEPTYVGATSQARAGAHGG